jgi:membrane-associated protein
LRLLKPEHLRRTEAFFARHGAVTILLSRFLPLIRTFAPFVAGVGRMRYVTFQGYNILGGVVWGSLFIWGGFLFGNIPLVKNNFGLVTVAIICVSLLPLGWAVISDRKISDPDAARP